MSQLAEYISMAAKSAAKRWPGESPDDLQQEIWVAMLEGSDLPPEFFAWVETKVRVIATRIQRRRRRRREIYLSAVDFSGVKPAKSRNPRDERESDITLRELYRLRN